MAELTSEDRNEIQQQIELYKANELSKPQEQPLSIPATPSGQSVNTSLDEVLEQESTPTKREEHRIRKRIRGIWRKWRTTALDIKSLETEKIACQIEIERAEAQAKLNKIKREQELADLQHWLTKNKGNLEEVGYNTTSKPSMFWYAIKRALNHISKITKDVPKIIINLFWGGIFIIGIIILKKYGIL